MAWRIYNLVVRGTALLIALASIQGLAEAQSRPESSVPALADSQYREARVAELRNRAEEAQERARVWAEKNGEPMRFVRDGTVYLLVDYTEERGPVYRRTHNVNAAISTAANLVRAAPYNLTGTNILAGIWDGGNVRATHTEFGGRVTNFESFAVDNHATHVAGTMIARGADAAALGMAPRARLDAYEFNSDLAEMTGRAMATPGQAGKIQISNHSYGYIAGWEFGFSPIRWYGTWTNGVRESDSFGQYSSADRDLDRLTYDAPYYLPFWSSGNDRNNNAPGEGTQFQYYFSGAWRTTNYNSSIHPFGDGWKQGGMDTISFGSVAKNILVIGAVNDAVSSGTRNINNATMTAFSSWGPTDDGRMKPDIVANGAGLYSSLAGSDTSYGTYSGTSMSAPNASGSALLLLQRFNELFPGQYMWASTIKALIIHTADDLPPAGPDYRTGWGLMNTKAAADHLALHASSTGTGYMTEGRISTTNTVVNYDVQWDSQNPVKATLVWTDPPGIARTGLNNTNLNLRNNLNLRIIGPNGVTNFPWILDPANPTNAATTGNNIRDNVEQVLINNPGVAGTYRVQVTYTGSLSNNFQNFSLIMSGIQAVFNPADQILLEGALDFGSLEPGAPQTRVMTIHNDGAQAVTVTNIVYPANFSGAWTGVIAALGSRDVPVTFLPPSTGTYGGALVVRVAETSNTASRSVSGSGARTLFLNATNPPGNVSVSNTVSTYDLRGVAGTSLVGQLRWTNQFNGASGTAAAQTNWLIAGVPLGVGSNTIVIAATNRPAGSVSATDSANQSVYSDGWTSGDNGGSGFNAWILSTTGPNAGHFRATSTANPNLNLGTEAWSLWANSGDTANAFRPLGRPLQSGDTFRVAFENNWITTGSSVGVALLNPAGQYLLEFFFTGGASTYTINDAITGRNTGIGYTDAGLNLAITMTGPSTYQLVAGATTITGTFAARPDMTITRFRAWNFNSGIGDNYNFYFNNLSVSNQPGAVVSTSTVAHIVRLGVPPVVDPIPAQTVTVAQTLSYTVSASNPEDDPMTFAVSTAAATNTWSLNNATGFFQFTPVASQTGIVTFSFTASDKDGTSAPEIMSVTVTPTPTAPEFIPTSPQTAFTTISTSFTVSATGYPDPNLALLETTASSGFSFSPGSGVLSYTPPYADAGEQMFTFIANNSEGTATQTVIVTVNLTPPEAPLAIWVSQTNATSVIAEWTPSAGAEYYALDVHTFASFTDSLPGSSGVEDFSNIGASSSAYATRIWTNNGIVWTGYQARTDQTIDGRTITLDNTAGSYFISGVMSGGVDEISLLHRRIVAGGGSGTFDIFVNTTKVAAAVAVSTSLSTAKVSNINIAGDFTIMITNNGNYRPTFDNLTWSNAPVVGGAYVPGYSNRNESATSIMVTGLTSGATYYLRVRAINTAGSSSFAPATSVTTRVGADENVIFFAPIGNQEATNRLGLSATASSGLPVTFAVSDGPAVVNDGTNLSFTGDGMVSVVASQPGDETWPPAEDVTNSFHVSKAAALILLGDLAQVYDGGIKSASATTDPAGLNVNVEYDDVPLNAGIYQVTATINEALYYGVTNGILIIDQAGQSIAFDPIGDQIRTNAVLLQAAASSGLPVVFTVAYGPALITDGTMTFTSTGAVAVTAIQPGNTNWLAAPSVTNAFWVFAFTDENNNNVPDEWELENFGSLEAVTEDSDADNDGMLDRHEYIAGTDPNDPGSLLHLFRDTETALSGDSIVIRWPSVSNRIYAVGRKSNLLEPFLFFTSGLPATPPMNVYTDTPPDQANWYYRISVEIGP